MIREDLYRELRRRAFEEGRSMSRIVNEALEAYFHNSTTTQLHSGVGKEQVPGYLVDNPWVQIIRSR